MGYDPVGFKWRIYSGDGWGLYVWRTKLYNNRGSNMYSEVPKSWCLTQ